VGGVVSGPARVLPLLGVVVYGVASGLHGGEQADDLPAVLPQYAANQLWLVSHAGQLIGMLMLLAGWVAWLRRSPQRGPATAGRAALALAAAIYTVNQAVDGIAIQHVAQAYDTSPPALQPTALLVADAVRHVEIGLTSSFQALVAVALVLTAFDMRVERRWFAVLSAAVGVSWLVLAAEVARNGFANPTPTSIAALALVAWVVALTLVFRQDADTGPASPSAKRPDNSGR
jgi:hypothetical protein